jgi:uncharacterized membrane protein YraQ (UPF0718 family)
MGYISSLWEYLLISAPYLLLGLFVSGLVKAFIDAEKLGKWLGQGKVRDVFLASFVGIPLPLCSCSVVPTAVTLRKNGASNAATASFLIATPESGVDSIAMTYGMMDIPMTIIRPIAAFFSATFAGILHLIFNDFKLEEEQVEEKAVKSCCSNDKTKAGVTEKLKTGMKYAFGRLIDDLSKWTTIGILLGALISFLVPENFFQNMGETQSLFYILLVGVPLYICASATTPIAASLILKGLSPGAALVLLLVGPATNLSNMVIIQKYIGKKGVMLNVFAIIFIALLFGELTNFIYSSVLKIDPKTAMKLLAGHQHNETFSIISYISAVVLSILLVKGIYKEEIKPRLSKKASSCH